MSVSRFVRTTSFKLSALYLALFLLSFAAVGGVVYVMSRHILDQQVRDGIALEVATLQAEYDEGGLPALRTEIEEKGHKSDTKQIHSYGVLDKSGTLVAGTIGGFAKRAGWQSVFSNASEVSASEDSELNMMVVRLDDRYWLGVGYQADYIEDALDAIIVAFSWGGLLVLILGAGGGYIMTRSFLGRVERITQSTQAIIAGDLKHRLHVGNSRDELDNLATLMNRMLDEICDLIDNIRQVSSDIAHDLRTLVSHLKFRLEETLHADLTQEEYQERVAVMVQDVDQILNTFSALLRISQIESGSRRSGFSTVDLSALLENVAEALGPVAEEKGKTISRTIEAGLSLRGDKELLTQMAYNLVENAIIHSGQGTHIEIDLARKDGALVLGVADDGPGIPDDQKEKVFRRFYRTEKSRTTPGNGLGLSIVGAVVDLHAAEIILSDLKPGLRVEISFDGAL